MDWGHFFDKVCYIAVDEDRRPEPRPLMMRLICVSNSVVARDTVHIQASVHPGWH